MIAATPNKKRPLQCERSSPPKLPTLDSQLAGDPMTFRLFLRIVTLGVFP